MSILTGPEIERLIRQTRRAKDDGFRPDRPLTPLPWIDVEPYRPACVGPNSLDVHLGGTLLRYDLDGVDLIDPRNPPPTVEVPADPARGGWVIAPGEARLGVLAERIECFGVVPWVDGRSSTGRLFVALHQTAGRGDSGYCGRLTLEITNNGERPIILRPADRLGQVSFMLTTGEHRFYSGRYQGDAGPVASRFHADGGR